MDLYRIIRELVEERDRLQRIINSLEGMNSAGHSQTPSKGKRRGRKSMDTAAREEVSERMKRYWARRRAARDGNHSNSKEDPKPEPKSEDPKQEDRLDIKKMAAGVSAEFAIVGGAAVSAG
jgi:hypothetical protein